MIFEWEINILIGFMIWKRICINHHKNLKGKCWGGSEVMGETDQNDGWFHGKSHLEMHEKWGYPHDLRNLQGRAMERGMMKPWWTGGAADFFRSWKNWISQKMGMWSETSEIIRSWAQWGIDVGMSENRDSCKIAVEVWATWDSKTWHLGVSRCQQKRGWRTVEGKCWGRNWCYFFCGRLWFAPQKADENDEIEQLVPTVWAGTPPSCERSVSAKHCYVPISMWENFSRLLGRCVFCHVHVVRRYVERIIPIVLALLLLNSRFHGLICRLMIWNIMSHCSLLGFGGEPRWRSKIGTSATQPVRTRISLHSLVTCMVWENRAHEWNMRYQRLQQGKKWVLSRPTSVAPV